MTRTYVPYIHTYAAGWFTPVDLPCVSCKPMDASVHEISTRRQSTHYWNGKNEKEKKTNDKSGLQVIRCNLSTSAKEISRLSTSVARHGYSLEYTSRGENWRRRIHFAKPDNQKRKSDIYALIRLQRYTALNYRIPHPGENISAVTQMPEWLISSRFATNIVYCYSIILRNVAPLTSSALKIHSECFLDKKRFKVLAIIGRSYPREDELTDFRTAGEISFKRLVRSLIF